MLNSRLSRNHTFKVNERHWFKKLPTRGFDAIELQVILLTEFPFNLIQLRQGIAYIYHSICQNVSCVGT